MGGFWDCSGTKFLGQAQAQAPSPSRVRDPCRQQASLARSSWPQRSGVTKDFPESNICWWLTLKRAPRSPLSPTCWADSTCSLDVPHPTSTLKVVSAYWQAYPSGFQLSLQVASQCSFLAKGGSLVIYYTYMFVVSTFDGTPPVVGPKGTPPLLGGPLKKIHPTASTGCNLLWFWAEFSTRNLGL